LFLFLFLFPKNASALQNSLRGFFKRHKYTSCFCLSLGRTLVRQFSIINEPFFQMLLLLRSS